MSPDTQTTSSATLDLTKRLQAVERSSWTTTTPGENLQQNIAHLEAEIASGKEYPGHKRPEQAKKILVRWKRQLRHWQEDSAMTAEQAQAKFDKFCRERGITQVTKTAYMSKAGWWRCQVRVNGSTCSLGIIYGTVRVPMGGGAPLVCELKYGDKTALTPEEAPMFEERRRRVTAGLETELLIRQFKTHK